MPDEPAIATEDAWNNSDKDSKDRFLHLWVIAGFLLLLVGAAAIFIWKPGKPGSLNSSLENPVRDEPVVVSDYLENLNEGGLKLEIAKSLGGFFNQSQTESAYSFVVGGDVIKPKVERYLEQYPEYSNLRYAGVKKISRAARFGIPFFYVTATFTNPAGDHERVMTMLPGKDRMLMDWEASFGFCELTWDEFLKAKPTEPVEMRVMVGLQKRPVASDQTKKFLVLVAGPDEPVNVFIKAGSTPAKFIVARQREARGLYPYTVDMRWNTEVNMPEIVALKHRFWIDLSRYRKALESGE